MPGTGHSHRYKGSISNRNTKPAFQVLAPWNSTKNGEKGQVPVSTGGTNLKFAKMEAKMMSNYDAATDTFKLDSNLNVTGNISGGSAPDAHRVAQCVTYGDWPSSPSVLDNASGSTEQIGIETAADFGRRVTCSIPPHTGKLLSKVYLQVTLPEINQAMNSGIDLNASSLPPTQQPANATMGTYTGLTTTSSGAGNGAKLTVVINPVGTVSTVSVTSPGNGYSLATTLTVSSGQITGATTDLIFTLGPGDINGVYARWVDYIGEHLISMVEVEIGGVRMDRQYGEWIHIWNQLNIPASKRSEYLKMVGQTPNLTRFCEPNYFDFADVASDLSPPVDAPRNALPETTLYIPLPFWFTLNPTQALLIPESKEIKITLEIRPIDQCLLAFNSNPVKNPQRTKVDAAYSASFTAASLYCEFVTKDDLPNPLPTEYLIEQLNFTGALSVGMSSNTIDLGYFNGPLTELIFVVQPDFLVDYDKALLPCSDLSWPTFNSTTTTNCDIQRFGPQPFNYSDSFNICSKSFILPDAIVTQLGLAADNAAKNQIFSDNIQVFAEAWKKAESTMEEHVWGENPVITAKLKINGQDWFEEREGTYFDLVQPYQYHTGAASTGINVFSFAACPESINPWGAQDASTWETSKLHLILSGQTVEGTRTAKVRVYSRRFSTLSL